MRQKRKLAMFDLDGTLFNTFEIHFLAYEKALKNRGYKLDKNYFRKECFGKYYTQFLKGMIPQATLKELDEIHTEKTSYFDLFIKDAKPNYPLFDIIKAIKKDYYLAVVTSSDKAGATKILKNFGYFDLFDVVIGGSDVDKHKPAPDCYKMVRDMFDVDSKDIIVFEDTKDGIEAAASVTDNIYVVKGY